MNATSAAEPSLQRMDSLWERIRRRLGVRFPPAVDCWLQDVGLVQDPMGNLVLLCSNSFSRNWLKEKYRDLLAELLRQEMGRDVPLAFELAENQSARAELWPERLAEVCSNHSEAPGTSSSGGCPAERDPAMTAEPIAAPAVPFFGWNGRFRFETFVVGDSNRFAWSAGHELCRQFRREYNPLLIQGGTGVGKTHLGQAIGYLLHAQDPSRRVRYCTSEEFFTDMIHHIKSKSILEFKEKYRKQSDVLILDDVQFASKKNGLQAELTYTLDSLLNAEKQIVLLGDLTGEAQAHLQESLRSRIFSGLTVSIQAPDHATRVAILRQFALTCPIPVCDATLEALADRVRSNVRDLESAFKRMVALHLFSNEPIGPASVAESFRGLPQSRRTPLSVRAILERVARHYEIATEAMTSRSRQRKVLYPRQIAMYLSRKHTCESLEDVGAHFNKDHSTVVYAVKSLEKKLLVSPRLRREVEFIERKVLEQAG
ncbi:MAG: chromosomal replication initiator protein DnaA [bacterium]